MKTYLMPVMTVTELKHQNVIVTSGSNIIVGPGESDDDDLDGDF
jgi:hypothetical protein